MLDIYDKIRNPIKESIGTYDFSDKGDNRIEYEKSTKSLMNNMIGIDQDSIVFEWDKDSSCTVFILGQDNIDKVKQYILPHNDEIDIDGRIWDLNGVKLGNSRLIKDLEQLALESCDIPEEYLKASSNCNFGDIYANTIKIGNTQFLEDLKLKYNL